MCRKESALALLVAAFMVNIALAAKPGPVRSGKLIDFTEERYNSDQASPFGSQSCVNRDDTVDVGDRVLVIRHSTCMPLRDPALRVVVGRDIQLQFDEGREDRVALLDSKGKPHWYRLFKTTEKEKIAK